MGACDEAFSVSLNETTSSADLGGSSKYSNEFSTIYRGDTMSRD